MDSFALDPRLAADCHRLGTLPLAELLLMDDARLPWLIVVPRVTEAELHRLAALDRQRLWDEVNAVAAFVDSHFTVDKLNIAALGNVVTQLHVHVVGRRRDDCCWPGVVWGTSGREPYAMNAVDAIRAAASAALGSGLQTDDLGVA